MKIVVLWKEDTDYAREVREWMQEFTHETGKEVESLNPVSTEGETFATARDILQFPAVVAVREDGAVLNQWLGTPLPQFDEVLFFVKEI